MDDPSPKPDANQGTNFTGEVVDTRTPTEVVAASITTASDSAVHAPDSPNMPRGPRWVPVAAMTIALAILILAPVVGWRVISRFVERGADSASDTGRATASSPLAESSSNPDTDESTRAPLAGTSLYARRAAASAALENGEFPRVINLLDPIIRDGHGIAEDYRTRAQAWLRLSDLDDDPPENLRNAAEDFARGEADDEFAEALARLGRWLRTHNRPREAVRTLEQCVAIKRTPGALIALSEAHSAAGQPEAARESAEAALRLTQESAASHPEESPRLAARADHALSLALFRFADALEKNHPPVPEAVADADARAEKHLAAAIAAAESLGMRDAEAWQRELDQFRELPRVAARAKDERTKRN